MQIMRNNQNANILRALKSPKVRVWEDLNEGKNLPFLTWDSIAWTVWTYWESSETVNKNENPAEKISLIECCVLREASAPESL